MGKWSDDPAGVGTPIRAVHINEIRTAVDRARALIGQQPWPWVQKPLTPAITIQQGHFLGLRDAIQSLWTSHGQGNLPNWSYGSPPSSSRPISARDINDLRSWMDHTDPWDNKYVGVNVDPTNSGNGSPDFSVLQAAHITGIRAVSTSGRVSYITNAANSGIIVLAVVGVESPDVVPGNSNNIVLEVGNEPDGVPNSASYIQTVTQCVDSWLHYRTSYLDRYMVTAGFLSGGPYHSIAPNGCFYNDFLDELFNRYLYNDENA